MTDDDLEAWILDRAILASIACSITREERSSIIARAMRDAVAEAHRLEDEKRAADRAEWVWEDKS